MRTLSRRGFVQTAAGLLVPASGCFRYGASAPFLQCHTLEQSPVGLLSRGMQAFPLGVWGGDAQVDRAVFGTRATGLEAREHGVELRVTEVHPRPRTVHRAVYVPDEDGFVYAEVTGLAPHATHRYAFKLRDGTRSALGFLRTAPAPGAAPSLTFIATSCTNARYGAMRSLAHAARCEPIDFWIHAGDHAYCDGARTLEAFRGCYARHWQLDGLRAIHAAAGAYVTWDDHEIANNWVPERVAPELIAHARRAMLEHTPVQRDPARPFETRLWRSFRWGETLELFVLDGRSERRRRGLRVPQYLSAEQLSWLVAGVRGSTARFKLVVNSVPITRFGGPFEMGRDDAWIGFAAQREELLEAVADVRGFYFIAGDYHVGVAGRVERAGRFAHVHEFLVGPGGSFPNPAAGVLDGPQWDFVTSAFGYTRFELDPNDRALTATFVDDEGRALARKTYRA